MAKPLTKDGQIRIPKCALQCKLKEYADRKTIKDDDDVGRDLRLFHIVKSRMSCRK